MITFNIPLPKVEVIPSDSNDTVRSYRTEFNKFHFDLGTNHLYMSRHPELYKRGTLERPQDALVLQKVLM